jgi:phosphoglycerate kinase
LTKVTRRLRNLLKQEITKTRDCINIKLPSTKIVVLENLRFHKEEKKNNAVFAKKLSTHADLFINDAFGTAHRKHASNNAITRYIPSYAGLLIKEELEKLNLRKSKKPIIAILGFAKLSDKIDMLKSLLKKVDKVIFAGLVTFTFLKAQGYNVGKTPIDTKKLRTAKLLLKKYKNKIVLPVDVKVAVSESSKPMTVSIKDIPDKYIGYDIGPESFKLFTKHLSKAKTVFWNGPLGMYENRNYARSTYKMAKLLSKKRARVIVGGGDTANAVKRFEKDLYHVSTGGGASLELISGKKLPAIIALEDNSRKFK